MTTLPHTELIQALHELIDEHATTMHQAITQATEAYQLSGRFVELTQDVLNGLQWNPYKTRSTGGWMFRNTNNSTLVSLEDYIIKSGGSADLHNYHYKISGDERQFINRWPRSNKR